MSRIQTVSGCAVVRFGVVALVVLLSRSDAWARGGWADPPAGFEYVYEASGGQDAFVAGDNVVGLLDGSWYQHTGTSYWDGSAPGVFNTTELNDQGQLLPPAPGGVKVIAPDGELGEDGQPLAYLAIEDVGDPTSVAQFPTAYAEPSNRKLYFYRPINGDSAEGWTLVARLRLSPAALDPAVNMTTGQNGADLTDLPMVAVHDTGEGTVGFSINGAGQLVVLDDGAANEVDIGNPTEWVTVWLSAAERPGTPEGRYDVKVFIDGSPTAALTLSNLQAPISEITGSSDDWISIGSGRTADDAAFQIDYVAYKRGAFEPGQTVACPAAFGCAVQRLVGRSAVNLTWTLPGGAAFDSFTLKRDGQDLATGLLGTSNSFVDLNPLVGSHTYELSSSVGGQAVCSSSCTLTPCFYDLQCTYLPGIAADTVDARLSWVNPGGIDGFSIRRRRQLADMTLEADEELGVVPGSASEFTDQALARGDLTRITYTVTATIGAVTCDAQCRPTTCPHDLGCAVNRTAGVPSIALAWVLDRGFDSIEVRRREDPSQPFTVLTTVAGTETSYTDSAVADGLRYDYEIFALHAGTAEACGVVGCTVFVTPVEAAYNTPAGGWDYAFDAEGAGGDSYNPLAGETGNLDGTWIRSTLEDHWDGSKPGDTENPPAGPAPGGVAVVSVSNGDPCRKEARRVLLLEDPGDPRVVGYPDPSNRKILLGRDLASPEANLLRLGVTFYARLRLRPVPVDIVPEPGSNPVDGDGLGKGLGMVGIYFRNSGTPEAAALGASAGFAVALGENSAAISTNPETALPGIKSDEFHSLWATIQDPEADGTYSVAIYINGQTTPFATLDTALQVPEPGVANNDVGFGATVTNFIAVGLPNTGADASVEIDAIAWKVGVHAPASTACEGGPPTGKTFRRADGDANGEVELTDAISLLNFLFVGGAEPACLDAADFDDNGSPDISDAIANLNFQFLGGPGPAPPGPAKCGADVDLEVPDLGCTLGC